MRQNKFKAVIIDDELLIRELLRKTVDWEQHGFEVIGEAADGVEGLELIGRVRPDIAVVDMNMPRMDGCTLCRNISELHPDCKIIVLSGYNEFDYVRSALLAGARDYLLKPIEPKRVEQVLDRLRNELEEKSQQHEQDERNDKFYKISRENFLKGLVSSPLEAKDRELLSYFDIRLSEQVLPIIVRIPCSSDLQKDDRTREAWQYGIFNIAEEMLEPAEGCYLVRINDTITILLDGACSEAEKQLLFSRLQKLVQVVAYYMQSRLTVLVGQQTDTLEQLHDHYLQALSDTKDYYSGEYCAAPAAQGKNRQSLTNYLSRLTDLRTYLLSNSDEQAVQTIENILDEMAAVWMDKPDVIRICKEIILVFNECLFQFDMQGWDEAEAEKTLKSAHDFTILRGYMRDITRQTLQKLGSGRQTKTANVVSRALQVIEHRYPESELCLSDIAEACNVHPVYLCRVFKKHTGYPVMEYLTHVRLEAAYKALESGELGVHATAEAVGYNDVYYFSKCFKKHFGISPSVIKQKKLM